MGATDLLHLHEGQAMKGRELLDMLYDLTVEQLELPVSAEGCDCVGRAVGITVEHDILICRDNAEITAPSDTEATYNAQQQEQERREQRLQAERERLRGYEHLLP